MMLPRKMLALALAGLTAAPALAQVVPPPGPKPAPTEFTPPPPEPATPQPRPATRQSPAADVSGVDFEPITRRDTDGEIIPLEQPVEYVAMSHNPLIDVAAMTKIAPMLYPRRQAVENLIIDNLGTMLAIQDGLIESMRMADEQGMRTKSGQVSVFTSNTEVPAFLHLRIANAFIEGRRVAAMTQQIMADYQEAVTMDAIGSMPTEDGATNLDQMMQKILRMSVAEHEYFYNRLMMDAADSLGSILPTLNLDSETAAAIRPLADKLARESDLDARASLIREIFGKMSVETQQAALRKTLDSRPAVNPLDQMDPVPDGATTREIDNETRLEMILQLLDGGTVDTSAFVE